MMQVRLIRFAANPKHGTFGVMVVDGEPFCVTLEPYARDNAPNVSCIPSGVYLCKRVYSGIVGGDTFEVTDVERRSFIRFHPGNTDDNTEGCIVIAQHFGKLGRDWAVLNSGKTFKRFMQWMTPAHGPKVIEFLLTIKEEY